MIRAFLLVGLGGGLGSMARYGISLLVSRIVESAYPFATFFINITGCFLIGLLFGMVQKQTNLQSVIWLTLATGFCGGFTTFSAFALENVNLFSKQLNLTALAYTLLSVVLGILLCRVGILLAT